MDSFLDAVRYTVTAGAVVALYVIPASGFLAARRVRSEVALAVAPVVTAGVFGAIAAAGVVAPVSVPTTSRVLVAVFALVGAGLAWRHRAELRPDGPTRRSFAIAGTLFVVVVSFLAVTSDPWVPPVTNAIPPGRVESPRVPGLVVDSHLPYRVAQITYHELGGDQLEDDFSPGWWISDRTPLVGLNTAVAAAVTGVPLPDVDPLDRTFERLLVDDAGYWFYLVLSAWLGVSSLLALHLLARLLVGARQATIATAVAALMPGVFLYAIYPRPSLTLAPFCLVALWCALRQFPVAAGSAVALAYLTHPTGLWWAVPVAIALVWDPLGPASHGSPVEQRQGVRRRKGDAGSAWARIGRHGLRAGGTALVVVLPWQYFTMVQMRASSKLLTWPLGSRLSDRRDAGAGVAEAWDLWLDRGIGYAVWVRVSALSQSIVPREFYGLGSPQDVGGDAAWYRWTAAHFYAAAGIAGIVISVLVIRGWPRRGDEAAPVGRVLGAVLGSLAVVGIAFEGVPESFVFQGLVGAVLLAAIPAAAALDSSGGRGRAAIVALVVIEFVSVAWTPALVAPVWTLQPILAVGIGVVANIGLGALLWSSARDDDDSGAGEPALLTVGV